MPYIYYSIIYKSCRDKEIIMRIVKSKCCSYNIMKIMIAVVKDIKKAVKNGLF